MTNRFAGKIAVITGGSTGMGLATAKRLVVEGIDHVFISGRRQDALDAAVAEIGKNVTAVQGDVANLADLDRLYDAVRKRNRKIDVLFANAGLYLSGDVAGGNPSAWGELIDTNIKGVLNSVHAVLPEFLAQAAGDILICSSISGHQAIHWEPVYSASKHAIQAFTHGLRRQLLQKGIRVGAIAPGMVLNELWGIYEQSEIDRRADLGEGLRSEDVAEAVLFMLTRPSNVTIRDLVMLPRTQDL